MQEATKSAIYLRSNRLRCDLMTTGSTGTLSSARICFARRLRMSLV
jgi:hypothetical protein